MIIKYFNEVHNDVYAGVTSLGMRVKMSKHFISRKKLEYFLPESKTERFSFCIRRSGFRLKWAYDSRGELTIQLFPSSVRRKLNKTTNKLTVTTMATNVTKSCLVKFDKGVILFRVVFNVVDRVLRTIMRNSLLISL
jgi:hypothetical protein